MKFEEFEKLSPGQLAKIDVVEIAAWAEQYGWTAGEEVQAEWKIESAAVGLGSEHGPTGNGHGEAGYDPFYDPPGKADGAAPQIRVKSAAEFIRELIVPDISLTA
jgi:hypothetical protein